MPERQRERERKRFCVSSEPASLGLTFSGEKARTDVKLRGSFI